MDFFASLLDLFLHLDEHLANIINQYGGWTYGILFAVIFVETGLVVMPFLPGDSLLFAAGTFAALGSLNVWGLIGLLIVAAITGDAVNYSIGHYLGERAYNIKWIKKEYLEKTHAFFEKYGGKAIFLARFVPIVRTFAPFVAGIGRMSYAYFATYNVVGGISWVLIFTLLGYFFGNIPLVKQNFELVIVAIILISVLPVFYEYIKARVIRAFVNRINKSVDNNPRLTLEKKNKLKEYISSLANEIIFVLRPRSEVLENLLENIASMSPEILEVVLQSIISPTSGVFTVAILITKKWRDDWKARPESRPESKSQA